jgi:hypothetical protein
VRGQTTVDDSGDNGRAKGAADGARGEGKPGGGGEEGVRCGELDTGYKEGEGARAADSGENCVDYLWGGAVGADVCVADCCYEEDGVGEY